MAVSACERCCKPGQVRKEATVADYLCDTIAHRFLLPRLNMSYLVIARKYRPDAFSRLVGQEQVTRTLANSIRRNTIAHAFVFSGPRGVGKTSTARILSKALNCKNGPTAEPCQECSACKEITLGTSLAVREIDGASHNSVDNVRDLIESFRSLPAPGYRYKIYIIDEVHMLSTAAFNALLKSLEEPPPNTIFILATTEVHKIPDTVLSRCQRHDFRAITSEAIATQLTDICKSEGITAESEALNLIARLADGSMRDAQSLLDRAQSYGDGKITAQAASELFGSATSEVLKRLADAIVSRQPGECIGVLSEIFSHGVDAALFARDFAAYWRDCLIAHFSHSHTKAGLSSADIQDLAHLARTGCDSSLRSLYPRYALEALVVRMATREPVRSISEILDQISAGHQSAKVSMPVPARPGNLSTNSATISSSQSISQNTEGHESPNGGTKAVISWAEFVDFCTERSRVLAEHLRRLSVERFDSGQLIAKGPEFSIASLKRGDDLKKLRELLLNCSGVEWKISLVAESGAEAAPGSLRETAERETKRSLKSRQEDLAAHPQVESLRRMFPGSKIEKIEVKE